jgi:quercetin 2,3-dioxygenase
MPKCTMLKLKNGATYKYVLSPNRTLAGLSIRGNGGVIDELEVSFENKDFIILQSEIGEGFTIQPKVENLRMLLIEIPNEVDYPLCRKPR